MPLVKVEIIPQEHEKLYLQQETADHECSNGCLTTLQDNHSIYVSAWSISFHYHCILPSVNLHHTFLSILKKTAQLKTGWLGTWRNSSLTAERPLTSSYDCWGNDPSGLELSLSEYQVRSTITIPFKPHCLHVQPHLQISLSAYHHITYVYMSEHF